MEFIRSLRNIIFCLGRENESNTDIESASKIDFDNESDHERQYLQICIFLFLFPSP